MRLLITRLLSGIALIALSAFVYPSYAVASCLQEDDPSLQALLNTGNVTLPAGRTYHITTKLVVSHAVNMNGCTIVIDSIKGTAIKLMAKGALISNGTITGNWDNRTAVSTNKAAIQILADNCTITKMNITRFGGYGIACGPYNNPTITYCNIYDVGYIGFYYDAEANTTGGTFSYNTIDRSRLLPATVRQLGVGIRGSTSNPAFITTGWTIINNTILMPAYPTDMSAECIEVRNMGKSALSGNVTIGGSIGISMVRSSEIKVAHNKTSNTQLEGLEFVDCKKCSTDSNAISSSAGDGVLMDGTVGCDSISLSNDSISGTTRACIHAYNGTRNLQITGCILNASAQGNIVILQGTNFTSINNCIFRGNAIANCAVMLDTCPGNNLNIIGGSVSNFTRAVVVVSNAVAGNNTENITITGVTITGVPTRIFDYLSQHQGLIPTDVSH